MLFLGMVSGQWVWKYHRNACSTKTYQDYIINIIYIYTYIIHVNHLARDSQKTDSSSGQHPEIPDINVENQEFNARWCHSNMITYAGAVGKKKKAGPFSCCCCDFITFQRSWCCWNYHNFCWSAIHLCWSVFIYTFVGENSHVYDASCPCLLVKSVVESLTHGQANNTQWKKGDIWSMVISGTDLLEVPTKKKGLLFRAKFQGISPPNMAWNMVQYLHFWVPKFPSML